MVRRFKTFWEKRAEESCAQVRLKQTWSEALKVNSISLEREKIRLSYWDGDMYICLLDSMWHKLLRMFYPQHIWFHLWAFPFALVYPHFLQVWKAPQFSTNILMLNLKKINCCQESTVYLSFVLDLHSVYHLLTPNVELKKTERGNS